MMLRNDIIANWYSDIMGHLQKIESIDESYPAYTIKCESGYGVAIPMEYEIAVNEDFSNAKLKTETYTVTETNEPCLMLTLITSDKTDKKIFSSLCEQFVYPGKYGEFRREIIYSPLKWWMEMKEILGNKNVESMVYDTLGELWTYSYLVRSGKSVSWNGPKGSSSDLEAEDMMVEVKSTLNRSVKEITVHGKNQLMPPEGKKLFLFYCVFEMSVNTGISINDIVYELAKDGFDVDVINESLAKKGFEPGKSSRDRKYILWEVNKYEVDDGFPRITSASFVDGREPQNIEIQSYIVNLSDIPYEKIVEGSLQI